MCNTLVDIVFLFDILVNFRTAVLSDEGDLITESKDVAVRYAKGWLVFDVLAGVPFVRGAVLAWCCAVLRCACVVL